jgi:hypothetical protein
VLLIHGHRRRIRGPTRRRIEVTFEIRRRKGTQGRLEARRWGRLEPGRCRRFDARRRGPFAAAIARGARAATEQGDPCAAVLAERGGLNYFTIAIRAQHGKRRIANGLIAHALAPNWQTKRALHHASNDHA